MPSKRRVAVAAALVGAVLAIAPLVQWIAHLDDDPRPAIYDVRLGMTADDVRDRMDARGPGTWSASAASGDWVLEHVHESERARFEMHDGQVMGIRVDAEATPELEGPALEINDSSVLVRERANDRIAVTLLSRSCPTHREEAEGLVRSSEAVHP